MSGDENDTVGDQLARRRDGLLTLAVIVGNDQFDRFAKQAAGLVQLRHGHGDTAFVLLAGPRIGAGQRRRRPDPDLRVRRRRDDADRESRTQQYACPDA